MFGFLVGVLVTVAVLAAMRRRRGRSWRNPSQWFARRMFEHIETMPGQESALFEEWQALQSAARGLREKMEQARYDVADLLRAEQMDAGALELLIEREKVAIDQLLQRAKTALLKTHQTLNPEQRRRAADLLQWGPRALFHRRHRYTRSFGRPDSYAW